MDLTGQVRTSQTLAPSSGRRPDAIVATDGELLMRFARHGDNRAFAQIVERHGGLVWIVCREVLGHHQDVEDAFQATFFILAERAATIRTSDSAAAWLHTVAQRTSLAARRKRARRREEELVAEPPQGEEVLAVIHDRQMIYALMEELRSLPERYQVPLVLRYLEGQSRRAIAEQTDSTIAQIQGRLVRGRRMLRSRLVRRGVSLSLAAGVMTSVSAEVGAWVTPALAAATAKNCLAMKTSGVAGGASASALALATQGVKAMWLATMMKTTAAVSTILIGAGIVWAVQSGGQPGRGAEGASAPRSVLIQAAAVPGEQRDEASTIKVEGAAPQSSTGGAATRDAQTVKVPASDPRMRIADTVTELQSKLMSQIDDSAKARAGLELQEIEKSLLRRELDAAHSKLMELKLSPNPAESDEAQKKRNESIELTVEQIEHTKDKLKDEVLRAALMSAELARAELNMSNLRQHLEEIRRIRIQIEFSQREQQRGAIEPGGTTDQPATGLPPQRSSAATPPDPDGKLEPQDKLRVRVANAFADSPLDSIYSVESRGTVALGPVYGRVDVKGLTVLEAEAAIKKHLATMIEDPAVQVTLAGKHSTEQAVERFLRQIANLQAENARLNQRIDLLTQMKSPAAALTPTKPGLDIAGPQAANDAETAQIPQLQLERESWRLKAQAFRLKSAIAKRKHEAEQDADGQAESLLMQADANHAEAMALELTKQLDKLKNNEQPAESGTSDAKKPKSGDEPRASASQAAPR